MILCLVNEQTLKWACALCFTCLKNNDAGTFFILKYPQAPKFNILQNEKNPKLKLLQSQIDRNGLKL